MIKTKEVIFRTIISVNDKNERQPVLFEVEVPVNKYESPEKTMQFGDFQSALQAYINRLD